jgi:hypothetical protein
MEWWHREEGVIIICSWLQAHIQVKTISKIVSIPFFIKFWKCSENNTWHSRKEKTRVDWNCFLIVVNGHN